MKVYRYEVPVDDRVHGHRLSGHIVQVASRKRGVVEFWAVYGSEPERLRYFRVFGTGLEIPIEPQNMLHCFTALDNTIGAVWHLVEGVFHYEISIGAKR